MDEQGSKGPRGEVFTKTIRAGKRTYFFDVKTTRSNEFYLTITESKKRFNQQSGKFYYEKHKVFLYPEDFEKFTDALQESFSFIDSNNPEEFASETREPGLDDVKFEDLDKEKEAKSEKQEQEKDSPKEEKEEDKSEKEEEEEESSEESEEDAKDKDKSDK